MANKEETNPFKMLEMQMTIDDVLDWIQENEPSFFDSVKTPEELTTKLMLFNPPEKDLTRDIIEPLVVNWWKEGSLL